MTALIALSPTELTIGAFVVFLAGVVRGFSGFALSALIMAVAAMFYAPIDLIPMLWYLEMTASLIMIRGGFQDADKTIALGLWLGTLVGLPIGLSLTTSLPVDTSKQIALAIILILAATQLARLRLPFLDSRAGLIGTGVVAGTVTGLANVGGMVIALFVLSRNAPARSMRASLVMFLLIGSASSMVYLLLFDVMTLQAALRGLVFALPAALGVLAGQALFIPRLEPYYRLFCLSLLMGLAGLGLARSLL